MNAVISQHRTRRIRTGPVLLLGPTLAVLLFGQSQVVHAQRSASATFGTFIDEVGIMVDGTFIPGLEATEEQLAGNPPLFENHSEDHLLFLMPDGTTPVTYNDIANVTGTLTVLDVGEQGTQVTMSADGLLPGGLYTAWIDLFQAPGFTPDFAHELAAGALGYDTSNPPQNPNDYMGNVFTADANGHGEIEAIQPPGPTSWFTTEVIDGFEVPPYVLDAPVAEFDIILAYHIDGNTYGDAPGVGEGFDAFDGTFVGYGAAAVVPEPSSLGLLSLGMLSILAYRRRRRVS